MENLGFIGTGVMARAILTGIFKKQKGWNIVCYDKNEANYSFLKENNVKFCSSCSGVFACCKYVVLAVKPQNYVEVLSDIKDVIGTNTVIVSIAAGINAEFVNAYFGFSVKFVQVMPNTPIKIGFGAVAISRTENVEDFEFSFAKDIFSNSAVVCEIPKDKMNCIVPINGSSPAFIYCFAKGFLNFAKKNDIDEHVALELFCNSLIGSAKMMLDCGKTIDELICEVNSKKGTTQEGLNVLNEHNFLGIVEEVCEKTAKRALELCK